MTPPTRTRSGGRAGRRALRSAPNFTMLPCIDNKIPICEILSGSQIEQIDATSMDILENVGVVFRDEIALADWKQAGAKVMGERIYPDRGLVRELIKTIPDTFTYHARDPERNPLWRQPRAVCTNDRRTVSARSGRCTPQPSDGRSGDVS